MTAGRSPWLIALAVVSAVHLVLDGADAQPWDSVTKCLIAPLLLGWAIERRAPRLLVAALALCFLGDLLLEIEGLFIAGMAAFAGAHLAFVTLFVRLGGLERLRTRPLIGVVYVAAAVLMVVWCWGGLDPALRPAIPVYAVLLVATASLSLAADARAGLGGALFLVSDGVIALSEAGRVDGDAVVTGLVIMTLYVLAIVLLATSIVRLEHGTLAQVRST
jgi:uncharacterized membrane protein YhhN